MILRKVSLFVGSALALVLFSSQAQAHWCDDLWASSYNILVKPESDTVTAGSSMKIYVQNNMGYQLTGFTLSASVGGKAITSTPPATLTVANTLLPGQKGEWTISGTGLTKIEDVTFSVKFGNSGQTNCYPTTGAKAVMVVKTDGTLYPGTPAGLDSATPPPKPCTGDVTQARSLQYSAASDFEDAGTALDKLMTLYCSGRASFGSTDGVSMTYCKDASSTTCPTSKPASGSGSKWDYMHLWAAGELAARKSALGTRLPVLRARLQCGANDGDVGFAGYALFMLGYLGDDATAKAFLQTQSAAAGDVGTIAKAALYLMGDTTQKAAVQTGAQSSSVFAKAACAAALGIVDKDDATVTSALIPQVQWTEPDTSNDGKGMYAAHLLALVAWDRRGYAANGADKGAVTFYGDTATGNGGNGGGTGGAVGTGGASGTGGAVSTGGMTGAGGTTGPGGTTGKQDASPGTDARPGSGGSPQNNGGSASSGGTSGAGGTPSAGGSANTNAGGSTNTNAGGAPSAGGSTTTNAGGTTGTGGNASLGGSKSSGGSSGAAGGSLSGNGGSVGTGGNTGSGSTPVTTDTTGCKCNLGGHAQATPAMFILFMAGLAWISRRRRRR